ncbi:MAG: HlyD family efflux transporter periplasmic adaptor subunit [Phycisphaerales bacterium]|nr:HlyD family efflux transporter periplasmic adaptor subunit [Planctomycetota bacterium]MCH8509519.1 HlyD family efflux transporter periplasmic adaptor subunit [Phycisphaerales bacterium]
MRDQTEPASDVQREDAGPSKKPARAGARSRRRQRFGLALGTRLLVIAALLVGAGVIFGLMNMGREQSRVRTEPPAPLTVRVVPADPRAVDRTWDGFGTVRSMNRAGVAPEVGGLVIERPEEAEAGRTVRRGDLLFAIDPADYEAALARAEQGVVAASSRLEALDVESSRLRMQAELAEDEIAAAYRDLERISEAADRGAANQGEVDARLTAVRRAERELTVLLQQIDLIPSRRNTLQAELAGLRADERIARRNLNRTRVTSPIDGVIHTITPRPGDTVAAGASAAEVVDLSRLEVPLRLPAAAAGWIDRVVGKPGAVSLWNGPAGAGPTHIGTITRLAPEADPASRTITVFVEVRQDPVRSDRMLPGSFVHARVRTPDTVERVILPRRAIRSGRVLLLVPDEGGELRVRPHPVRTGYAIDGRFPEIDPTESEWIVLDPETAPPPGSKVAVTALEQLEPGARVLVSDEAGVRADRAGGG